MPSHGRLFFLLTAFTLSIISFTQADDAFNNLIQTGKYQDAIQYADKQIPVASRTVDIWLDLALAYQKTGATKDQILSCYKEAQKVNPSEPRVLSGLGAFYFDTKYYTEALKLFQSSFLLKRSAATAEKMALCAASLNQWEKAKDAAETAISIDSTVRECRPILVKLYSQEKNWAAAVQQLEVMVKGSPESLDLWKQLAECCEKAGMKNRLPSVDSMIVLLDKSNVSSRARLADYALAKQDTATALRLFKELAILTPADPKPFKNLYLISKARGNTDDATLYLKNYLILDSSNIDLHWQLGDFLYAKKDMNGAYDSYHRAFRGSPKTRGHLKQFADIVLQKKLENEAISVITAAIAASEADNALYTALGDIYKKRNQCLNAMKMYQVVLKNDPKNVTVLSSLADCQAKTGDAKNAIITYEQIVLLNPQAALEYKALGNLQMKAGKQESAIASYRKYLETVKNDFAIASIVGLYQYNAKAYPDAVKYLSMVPEPSRRDVSFSLALGLSCAETGDCKTAIEALNKVWMSKPVPSIRAQFLRPLAACYESTGNAAKAAEAYEAYTKLPGIKDADAAFKAAFLKETVDRAGAIKAYTDNTTAYPKEYRNFLRLGLLYSSEPATLAKSAAMLVRASGMVDTVRVLWRTLAAIENKFKNEPKELAALTKLLALESQDIEANRRAGVILAGKKQHAKAITHLEIVAVSTPQDFDLLQLLAACYQETKRPQETLALLRKAKALRPDDPAILVKIIAAAAAVGGAETADREKSELAEIDKKTVAKDKKNVESRIRLIEYYYAKKDLSSAYPLLKELAVLTPKDPVVYRKLYEISNKNGDKKESVENLQKYLALDPANANAWRSLADFLFEQKEFDGALAAYRNTVKFNPQLKGFYKNYISIVLEKKLESEAMTVIPAAIKFQEADLPAYLALGDIYRKKNKNADAIKIYQDALKLDPKNTETLTALAECQADNGDVKNAILSYEQLVLMKPKPGKEYKSLGDLQMKAGATANAMESYQKYLADNPADQATSKTVGIYKYNQKQYKDAINLLELVKNPPLQNVEYLVALGDCYYQTGQTKKTIELFSRAWSAKPPAAVLTKVLKTLAECYVISQDPANALEAYDAYTRLPGVLDPEASYKCGYLREKTDRAGAIRAYTANMKLFPKDYRNFVRLGLLMAADSTAAENAATVLKAASAMVDTIPVLWETLAKMYGKLRNENGELQALQKLLSLQPQNIEANTRASTLLIKRKQIAQAITALEIVLTTSPNDVPTLLLLADCYLETKRPAQALDLLSKAKNLDKKNIAIRYKLYELYEQGGQDQKAMAEIKELIDLTKENKYRVLYAQDLIVKQQYDEALKTITEVTASEPMNLDALMLRASVQKAQKKYDEAIETYKDISYINENHLPALQARAETYLLMGKYDRAEQFYNKVLKLDPKSALAELGLALAAKAQKNSAGYQEHLGKAKSLDPKNPQILQEAAKGGKE